MNVGFYHDFYQSLFVHNTEALLLTAPDGQILSANPAACRMLGRTEDEIRRLGRDGVVDSADPHLAAALAERARTGSVAVELTLVRADGSRFPAEVTSTVFEDGNGESRTSMLIRDISERRRMELEHEQYARFFRLATDPMCIADPFGRFKQVNPAFVQLTGYAENELIARPFLDFVLQEDRQRTTDEMTLQVAQRPSMNFENRYVCKDGRVLLLSWTAYFDAHNGETYATARDVTTQRQLEVNEKWAGDVLRNMQRINHYLLLAETEDKLYQFVCDTIHELDRVAMVWIGLKQPDFLIRPVATAGIDLPLFEQHPQRWGGPAATRMPVSQAIQAQRVVFGNKADVEFPHADLRALADKLGAVAFISAPIQVDGDVIGAITIWGRTPITTDNEELSNLARVTEDIAIGVRSLRMARKLKDTLTHLEKSLMGTVEAISKLVEYRDPYTVGHERRVAQLASAIGLEMGLPESSVEGLRVIGYLHDLGKIAVPAEILSKPGRLSDTEMKLIRAHVEAGYQILKDLDFSWPVAQTVLQHHERLDGSGYPAGLKGEQISLEARILAVADTVEAVSMHRPYRAARGIDAALDEIRRHRETLYDPIVVDACIKVFREHKCQWADD